VINATIISFKITKNGQFYRMLYAYGKIVHFCNFKRICTFRNLRCCSAAYLVISATVKKSRKCGRLLL